MEREDQSVNPGEDGLSDRKDDNEGKPSTPRLTPAPQKQRVQQQQAAVEVSRAEEEPVSISPELSKWIKLNAKDLKIRQADNCWAAEVVNDFQDNLLKFLRSNNDQPYFQSAEFLTTGSYFEKVKIHSPNEFNMMLKLQAPSRLDMKDLDGGLFYRLDFTRPTRSPIQAFLLENERTLSSSKILNEMYRLVRKFLKTYKVPDKRCHWEVNRKRPNSPAVTLSLLRTEGNSDELISVDVVPALEVHPRQGWPLAARNGPDVDNWLGKKVRQEIKSLPFYFIPKRMKGTNLSEDAKESWRISFSHVEKKIIMTHGNKKTCCERNSTKCCRKQCLMLLKSLIEGLKQRYPKELNNLCSYHGKTAFLHTLSIRFSDSMWDPQQLPACFMHLLGALENHARNGDLPHFFVPNCNLFSPTAFPRRALDFLVNALEEQRMKGLPLLKPATPVPPLRPSNTPSEDTPSEMSAYKSSIPVDVSRAEEELLSISPELSNWIKLNAKDLKIRQTDRCWAAEVVNDFRDNLLKFLRSNNDQPYFQSAEFLTTGSYFEKVKIHSPNEFDMMLKLQAPSRLDMKDLDGGLFYRLDFTRPTRSPIQAFLLENERTLSSSKILNEMYRLVRKFLKTYKVPDKRCHWEVNRKRPNSPAVTLSLLRTEGNSDELISVDVVPALEVHPRQGWPLAARNGPDVDNWLGKEVRQEIKSLPFYFIPKRMKGRNLGDDAKESWRISFSHVEKKIIMNHGNKKTCCERNSTKCCRKQCLMLLKSLIEGLKLRYPKELNNLCSYHGKTAFLHTLSIRFSDSMWDPQQLPACFMHLLWALENHARNGDLPHFFVPNCNLFSPTTFPRRALNFLVNALEEQRMKGLPLLKPAAPVPPLRPSTTPSEDTPTEMSAHKSSVPGEVYSVDSAFMKKLAVVFTIASVFVYICI